MYSKRSLTPAIPYMFKATEKERYKKGLDQDQLAKSSINTLCMVLHKFMNDRQLVFIRVVIIINKQRPVSPGCKVFFKPSVGSGISIAYFD